MKLTADKNFFHFKMPQLLLSLKITAISIMGQKMHKKSKIFEVTHKNNYLLTIKPRLSVF